MYPFGLQFAHWLAATPAPAGSLAVAAASPRMSRMQSCMQSWSATAISSALRLPSASCRYSYPSRAPAISAAPPPLLPSVPPSPQALPAPPLSARGAPPPLDLNLTHPTASRNSHCCVWSRAGCAARQLPATHPWKRPGLSGAQGATAAMASSGSPHVLRLLDTNFAPSV